MEPAKGAKPTFDSVLPELQRIVASRRGAWTYLSLMEFADVSQELMLRLWKKYPTYKPERGSLEHWANRLITNALINLRRDTHGRYSRPCTGGGKAAGKSCTYNTGGETCSYTKSGKQCAECPLYKEWEAGRRHQFNIKSTVALENHTQEVSSQQGDFCDIASIQQTMHRQMKENLTRWEWRIYTCVYIRHLSPAETGAVLEGVIKKWKRAPRTEEQHDYQFILSKQRWFKEMMYEILKREGYDLEAFLDYER